MIEVLQGDVLEVLAKLTEASVHCCVTSPPYWGLRDYGIEPSIWGGAPGCVHEWGEELPHGRRGNRGISGTGGNLHPTLDAAGQGAGAGNSGCFCQECSAWRGALGLEPTIDLYVEHIVQVFRQVRRVLRADGTCWLNLGDCYNSGTASDRQPSRTGEDGPTGWGKHGYWTNPAITRRVNAVDLKPKDLCMVPFRVALALQADGWYLRSVIPWLKHNGMPESTDDRPTSMVEHIFLLAKSEDAYYDREAVRIAARGDRGGGRQRAALLGDRRYVRMAAPKDAEGRTGRHSAYQPTSRARRNSDWFFASLETYARDFQGLLVDDAGDPLAMIVNPQPFSIEMCDACETCYDQREYRKLPLDEQERRVCGCGSTTWLSHFATFPEQMVTPCILAGSSEHGCCSVCGAPYDRILERAATGDWHPDPEHKHDRGAVSGTAKWAKEAAQSSGARVIRNVAAARAAGHDHENPFPAPATLGWRPSCSHPLFPAGEAVPCTVLDPFAGSGRTGLAAAKLGRRAVLIERNPKYVRMIEWQVGKFERRPPAEDVALSQKVAAGG